MALREQDPVRYATQTVPIKAAIDRVWVASSGGTVFTDETADANSVTAADVALAGTVVDDAIYICQDEPFLSAYIDMSTNAVGGARVAEYHNGTTWTTLTVTALVGAVLLTADSVLSWDPPSNWTAVVVNGDPARFAIRIRTTTVQTTAGVVTQIGISPVINLCTAKTITLASNTSRAFRDVFIRVDITSSAASVTDRLAVRARLGGGSWATLANLAGNSLWTPTESMTTTYFYNCTTLFTNDFGSGTSQTLDVQVALGERNSSGSGTTAVASCHLTIGSASDDADATQMGSIEIVGDSITGNLSTTMQNLGSVPNWSTFLGETGVTVVDQWIEFWFNADEGGTTDWSLAVRANAESETTLVTFDAANNSDYGTVVRWSRPDLAANAAHTIDARVTSITGAVCTAVGIRIGVTYSYTGAARRTRHRRVPFALNPTQFRGGNEGQNAIIDVAFWVPEKLPTLMQSGIILFTHQSADPGNYYLGIGTQAARLYQTAAAATSGVIPYCQRFDSGAVAGSGITFDRGKNTLRIEGGVTVTETAGGGEYGWIDLVYTWEPESGKNLVPFERLTFDSAGFGTATVRREYTLPPLKSGATVWFVSDVGFIAHDLVASATGNLVYSVLKGVGMLTIPQSNTLDANLGTRVYAAQTIDACLRLPGDLDPDRAHLVQIGGQKHVLIANSGRASAVVCGAWHDYARVITKQVTGSAGSTVGIWLHDTETSVPLLATNRVGNGTYNFTWYDDHRQVYTVAREDRTHLSRSDDFTAGL